MINIAICDDSTAITAELEELITNVSQVHLLNVDCNVFFDGYTLIKNIENGAWYDLIFLDIEMPLKNGIHAAEYIRALGLPVLFIFVSSHEQYFKDIIATEPFRFLSKPLNEEAFTAAFLAAAKRLLEKPEYFSYSYNKGFYKILLKNIYYFESNDRLVTIHTTDGPKTFYRKLSDVEKQIAQTNSLFCESTNPIW